MLSQQKEVSHGKPPFIVRLEAHVSNIVLHMAAAIAAAAASSTGGLAILFIMDHNTNNACHH